MTLYDNTKISQIEQSTQLDFSDDGSAWQNYIMQNLDSGYGAGIMSYAERWGKCMQYAVDVEGKKLDECYKQLSFDCDWEGMSGFSFGCAVETLVYSWKYGSELRVCHNREYGVSNDVPGVVNPAILTFSV